VPTLIVLGGQDQFLSRSDQERVAASIPRSPVVYEGVGHIAHWEQSERIAVDLVAFVENLPR
jgi:pimeloyl-ACP methyl ester carboxylesterase